MTLPNCEAALIPKEKITGYLLSTTHRDGRHKAAFFMACGFSIGRWQQLAQALRQHAADGEVTKKEETPFGVRYTVEGALHTPEGRSVNLRVIWFVEQGEVLPRLVTAYPLPRDEHAKSIRAGDQEAKSGSRVGDGGARG